MDNKKRTALEAAGWCVGSASDFLGLTSEEERYVEAGLLLSEHLRKEQQERQLSNTALVELPEPLSRGLGKGRSR